LYLRIQSWIFLKKRTQGLPWRSVFVTGRFQVGFVQYLSEIALQCDFVLFMLHDASHSGTRATYQNDLFSHGLNCSCNNFLNFYFLPFLSFLSSSDDDIETISLSEVLSKGSSGFPDPQEVSL